jgi:hypothetical protein
MKIRTLEELNEQLGGDLAWRKKEIATLTFLLDLAENDQKSVITRASIAMIYAHWEGFVRASAESYLTFVATRRIPYKDLNACFAIATFRRKIRGISSNDRISDYLPLMEFLLSELDKPLNIPTSIDTESNLSYGLFAEILSTVGLDSSTYESKRHLIDEKLLHYRNNIAHGKAMNPDRSDFQELKENVVEILDNLRTQIEEAAISRGYRRS